MRLSLLPLSASLLLACEGYPLVEGTYEISADGIYEDTCGTSTDPAEIPVQTVTLTWPSDDTILMVDEEAGVEYTWSYDGTEITRSETSSSGQIDACEFMVNSDFVGTVASTAQFWVTEFVDYYAQGQCDDIDTSPMPCNYELDYTGRWVE